MKLVGKYRRGKMQLFLAWLITTLTIALTRHSQSPRDPQHTPNHPLDIIQTPCRYHSATLWKCWDGAMGKRLPTNMIASLSFLWTSVESLLPRIWLHIPETPSRHSQTLSRQHPKTLQNPQNATIVKLPQTIDVIRDGRTGISIDQTLSRHSLELQDTL